jgi:peptidoglycan hydrolase-like protein with peptidoglycan-binding domain
MHAVLRSRLHVTAAAVLAVALLLPAVAEARRPARPVITSVRCWPVQSCGSNPHVVAPGGRLRFRGRNLIRKGMYVVFRGSARSASGGASGPRALTAKLRLKRPDGYVATVPVTAHSGRIRIVGPRGVRSNVVGPISVRKPAPRQVVAGPLSGTAFDGSGMWIWYVSKSSGGSVPAILAQAAQYGVKTVFVKSSDGTSWWDQFSPALISQLKAGGLHVCAWQFVYGKSPATEASLGARAAQTGADCLAIDAEGQYEGLYSQAQTYIEDLRSAVGPNFAVSLASFPYVDYHPALPYSVFLGPGGAQFNQPQVYWKAIGTSPDTALAHTYQWNTVYGRPIVPLGQLYDGPSTTDVQRFRALAVGYGATGVSWWSWQSASQTGWGAIAPPDPAPAAVPPPAYPLLKSGAKGDVVVWAQEHLMTAGAQISASGKYDSATVTAVSNFQAAHGLPVNGTVDQATWTELLKLAPAPVSWASRARSASARHGRNGPWSARLSAKRDEIPSPASR